jgi:SAM-dependent methyltransferase
MKRGSVPNLDPSTVEGFGDEWVRFNQADLREEDKQSIFLSYFDLVRWEDLPPKAVCADIGCGSGRWASVVCDRVHFLHLVDASAAALEVARTNLGGKSNVGFHLASVDALPFADESLDFVYSLGVLHHVPDTAAAIRAVAQKLKRDAQFLIYLYYSLDNRPLWFRLLWKSSELPRLIISRMPHPIRYFFSQVLAYLIYWPTARMASVLDRCGWLPASWPLSIYRDKGFYVMRTDALDRFGTRLERRFSRAGIETMLLDAGLKDVRFSNKPPYWVAISNKA